MEHFTFQPDQVLADGSFDQTFYDANAFQQPSSQTGTWPLHLDQTAVAMSHNNTTTTGTTSTSAADDEVRRSHAIATTASLGIRTSMPAVTDISPLQTTTYAYSQAFAPSAGMLTTNELAFGLITDHSAFSQQHTSFQDSMAFTGTYGMPIHQSPVDNLVAGQEPIHNNSIDSSYMTPFQLANLSSEVPFPFADLNNILENTSTFGMTTGAQFATSLASHSPQDQWLTRSLSSSGSEHSWTFVDLPQGRQSVDGYSDVSHNAVVSPMHLHIRTDSNSSQDSEAPPLSAHSNSSGYVELFQVSPEPESHDHCDNGHVPHTMPMSHAGRSAFHSPMPVISTAPSMTTVSSPSSSGQASSPDASVAGSPKTKRRNSPISPAGVTQKTIVKKKPAPASKEKAEKKVGRRKGPLRPEQRQQAHEIRKLRACLRCKFLKKVCDKGDPCSGCKPSHARLWQVPCTRLAIQDIAYFLKGWNADYERHVTMQVSIANIKGFSPYNRELCITHGYGYMFRVRVREVFLVDDKDMGIDWVETIHETPREFEMQTARLSADNDGISRHHLSQYVEQHLFTFEKFVDEYFESTPFVMELLKTIYRHYVRTQNLALKKGLKLVIAYALTLHITLIHPESSTDYELGVIADEGSRYFGQIASPVMINFQVKKAMADLWREYMKDVLEELSQLYASVYSGDKLKNWPTIFMLAALILTVWEMMQFDQNYRVPDKEAVAKFCDEMESVPVGVIVGLFSAISTKMPTFLEWDSSKHSQAVQDNRAVCDTMTEVRAHVEKHEAYLRARPETAVYNRDDFDSLSNKFLSKLVIRSNGAS
ncbi:uncharacterized protein PV09_07811 [Verruconis gallopava]|uniref:Zn(2)-C6 fungal-type domain-containing protein n=1 Tax=Verruconis gallopava TaxID=253628 RepID=A0A0D2ANB6_9PEZI|nr:uncharacterized protein PV09_07811 [Verruconis gallopava]KIW00614.1 hypothetical protein PV09_07811 [Verruconis gallopava]